MAAAAIDSCTHVEREPITAAVLECVVLPPAGLVLSVVEPVGGSVELRCNVVGGAVWVDPVVVSPTVKRILETKTTK